MSKKQSKKDKKNFKKYVIERIKDSIVGDIELIIVHDADFSGFGYDFDDEEKPIKDARKIAKKLTKKF